MTLMDEAITKPWINHETQRTCFNLEEEAEFPLSSVQIPIVSSGISASAVLVQEYINIILSEKIRWHEAITLNSPNEIEKEIVALLPPQKSRYVKLHIRNIIRPNPMISLKE